MPTAYINIGSNKGDRRALIAQAVTFIEAIEGQTARCSRAVESEPWGFESAYAFINVGVAITTELGPEQLLRCLLEAERKVSNTRHRNADGSYRDRHIDIDLIAYDEQQLNTTELTLPHPRMHLRRFVLEPMMELAPHWRHPLSGLTCSEMLQQLSESTVP